MKKTFQHQSAFCTLKPLCIDFLKDCSCENIDKLEIALNKFDPECVESLQEFIVLPFRAHLTTELSEKVTIKCIDFLTGIFKKSRIKELYFFADIFNFMVSKISSPQDIDTLADISEELKLSICENILCLIQSSSANVLNQMYSFSFRPNLAHAIFVLTKLLKYERSKTLQKAVLSTLGALTYNKEYVQSVKMTEEIASEALASCLPGLSVSLQNFICGDDKRNHGTIIMALKILTDLIILVMGDESYERSISNDITCEVYQIAYKYNEKNNFLDPATSSMIPVVIKNESWIKNASEKLEILIKNLNVLTAHNHWKVRIEFLNFTKSLLFKCTKTLENCIPTLLHVVFGLSVDSNEVISTYCTDLLISFSEHCESRNSTSLNNIIQNNIEELTSQLIKYKFSTNDQNKIITLKSLQGYIEILGSSLNKLLFSLPEFERIILVLISLLEYDISVLSLIEEIPVFENFNTTHLLWPRKRFKFFENEEIFNIICNICYSLGRIGNSQLLIDYLLEKLLYNNLYTLQCISIIGNVVKGFSAENDASQKYSALVSEILEVFLSPSLFNVQVNSEENVYLKAQMKEPANELVIANNEFNKNKLQICLLLEAIAKCSECLGSHFKLHLMNVLCPVMEKAGNSNYIISQCGRLCLYYVAQSCKYDSVEDLIKDNADYVTNILMINLHQCFYKSETAVILCVIIEQCDSEAITLFKDLIFQILNILDYNQAKAYNFMRILFSVITYLQKWFPSKKYHNKTNASIKNIMQQNLKSSVLDYLTFKKTALDFEPEISNEKGILQNGSVVDDVDINHHPFPPEENTDVPLHINITCEIFKRCIYFQSSENAYLRMLSLEIVEICIMILRDHENQLLPLIHEFWGPFLRRFTEDTFISKSFHILLAIADECGDFVRRRTFVDVIPKLIDFLNKEYFKSGLKCNFKHYQWTSDHSLQVLMLSEIGKLCVQLDTDNKDINAIINACLPYLDKQQPEILQKAAMKSLEALATFDPDAVWFYWNVLYCKQKTLIPPHKNFLELSFPYSNNSLTSMDFKVFHT